VRYVIVAWAVVKFTVKLRHPDAVHHIGLVDFITRLPSNTQLVRVTYAYV